MKPARNQIALAEAVVVEGDGNRILTGKRFKAGLPAGGSHAEAACPMALAGLLGGGDSGREQDNQFAVPCPLLRGGPAQDHGLTARGADRGPQLKLPDALGVGCRALFGHVQRRAFLRPAGILRAAARMNSRHSPNCRSEFQQAAGGDVIQFAECCN